MPVLDENSTNEDYRYARIIKDMMIHECHDQVNGCLKDGVCGRKYRELLVPETYFDEDGYPCYARPTPEDCYIVPHVKQMLLDDPDGCHINTEFCGSSYCIIYLYKYLFKGNRKMTLILNNLEGVHPEDQILNYMRGRMITSMEAAWRVLGYDIYPALYPSVHTIKLKTPLQMREMNREGVMSEFQIYLRRPAEYAHLTFREFYKNYDYNTTPPRNAAIEFSEVDVEGLRGRKNQAVRYYMYKLQAPRVVVRLSPIPWNVGEIWWLRMIIYHVPVYGSAESAMIVRGVRYPTFQEAAIAHGLLEGTNEAEKAFQDAVTDGDSPSQLRSLFVALTIEGFPTLLIFENSHLAMAYDINDNRGELLSILNRLFRLENKDMTDYGLPPAPENTTMIGRYLADINIDESITALGTLHHLEPNTEEMNDAYDHITHAINYAQQDDEAKFFVIDSIGGSGKTTFAKKIYHYVRSKQKIVLGGAATGLATTVYGSLDFETFHTLFAIPVIEDEEEFDAMGQIFCNTTKDTERTDLINEASVFILDEAFSVHKYCYSAIMGSYNSLKGKVVLLLMDRGQTAPVVKSKDTRHATVDATILKLPIWNRMVKYAFLRNLRLESALAAAADDASVEAMQQYAKDLTDFRTNGINGLFEDPTSFKLMHDEPEKGSKHFVFKNMPNFTDMDLAIQWMYPNGLANADHGNLAIMATLNKDVKEWNTAIQKLNPNEEHILLSANFLGDIDDPNGHLRGMLNFNTLQFWEKTGVPKHELKLKVGDVCFLMRGLYKGDKLAKNTRVRILSISPFRISVCRLTDPTNAFSIPRIRFKITHFLGFTLVRTQFPLELAYAMSKNKAQGQGFQKCLIDIRAPVFAHGQEYVAFSRLRDVLKGAVFCNESQLQDGAGHPLISNVVYPELFL